MVKVAFHGAGYIAQHHLNAVKSMPHLEFCGCSDVNFQRAEKLCSQTKKGKPYTSFQQLLTEECPEVVHILTPPDDHYSAASLAIEAGAHVFLEKPMCEKSVECHQLVSLAAEKSVRIGVNHNLLFYPAYLMLKKAITENLLGKLDHITVTWWNNMESIQHGPYGMWMLREPQNLWLETGPHLCSVLIDLIGKPDSIQHVEMDKLKELPNQAVVYRQWNVLGKGNNIDFDLRFSCNPGFSEKSVEIRGQAGYAKVDFLSNTYILKRHTCKSLPFDIYYMNKKEGLSLQKQGRRNILNYIASKLKLARFGDPYAVSITNSITHFYDTLKSKPSRFIGADVVELCNQIKGSDIANKKHPNSQRKPADVLVLGGTGFIGSALVNVLVKAGHQVRVLARDPSQLQRIPSLDIIKGDILSQDVLKESFEGIKTVFHLATAHVNSWKDYLAYDVEATRKIGEACAEARVDRLIYTGTIDSYYAGNEGEVITEKTPLDPKIHRRNWYAQAKAMGEKILTSMNIPLVIARPGIVLGEGASPFHWGVAMWHYETSCQLWGKGNHPLPFVLLDDVVQGLTSIMNAKGIEGESFNFVDQPCLSGLEYVNGLEDALQAKINIYPTPIWKFASLDLFKWMVKVLVNHPDRRYPSWRDWASRTQSASFCNNKARSQLNWKPANDKSKLIENGIKKPAMAWWS